MLGAFLEERRQILILILSALILAGSGVAIGFGVAEIRQAPPAFQSSGFETAENQTPTAAVPKPVGRINLNTAPAAELEVLPVIGPALARRIVDYRTAHGPFRTTVAVQDVPGIGPAIYAQIEGQITVSAD